VFVPWSWRDVAVYNRWWVSLWQNCLRITNAWLHNITCYRNDVNQVGSVAGGSLKCRGYFVATQVFVLLALGWGISLTKMAEVVAPAQDFEVVNAAGGEAAAEEAFATSDEVDSPDIKLFGKWLLEEVTVSDISLADYMAFSGKGAVYVPHTAGRYQAKRFRKAAAPIVERLLNSLMMHGRNGGKKIMAVRIVRHAFEIIHLSTGENPVQVLVDAIAASGPREDSTRIGRAGTVRRQSCDVSPLRRVNQGIYLLTTGAREAAFRNIKSISECLADELINAAKGSSNSYAIKKKDELERVAKSNR